MKKIILFFVPVFLLISAGVFFYKTQKISPTIEKDTTDVKVVAPPTIKIFEPDTKEKVLVTKEGTVMRYTSSKLGITFTYVDNGKSDSTNTYVLPKENTVCVTYDVKDDACEKGQSVAVFSKKRTDTLSQAIENSFLKNISKEKCFVEKYEGKFAPNFESAQIGYPEPTELNREPGEIQKECPPHYSKSNGIRYFLSDKKIVDKFAFFNIGQYPIIGDDQNHTWQETFSFLGKKELKWKIYKNVKYGYSIQYPENLKMAEFSDTKTGASFGKDSAIIIDRSVVIGDGTVSPTFEEYVNVAASNEIQNYKKLATKEKINTTTGLIGYKTTWQVGALMGAGGKLSESFPITYFETKEKGMRYTIQVRLNDEAYLDTYLKMIKTFAR